MMITMFYERTRRVLLRMNELVFVMIFDIVFGVVWVIVGMQIHAKPVEYLRNYESIIMGIAIFSAFKSMAVFLVRDLKSSQPLDTGIDF